MTEEVSYPRFPEIDVELVGQDGNAFAILGACRRAMKRAKLDPEIIEDFMREATSGDYDDLLQTAMKWFNVY